jgi:hypothetical protein
LKSSIFDSGIHLFKEYSIQLFLRLKWLDERLKIEENGNKLSILEGGKWHIDRIWTPSIHILNNKVPNVLQNDQNPILTRIQSNGEVLVSKRFD